MITNLKDKLGMYLKVQDNLKDHAADYASHPKLATASAELDVKVTAIFDAASRFDIDNTGVTEDKALKRTELVEVMFKIGKALKSMAGDTPKNALRNRVTFSLSELQQMRDADLHLRAMQLKQFAQDHLLELASYRVEASDLTALDSLRDDFLKQIPNPKDENDARSVAGLELENLFTETDKLLVKIDDYIDTYRFEQPLLWEEYQLSRGIDQTGSRVVTKPTYAGVLNPGQLKVVVNVDYVGDRRFVISNTGQGLLAFSLNHLNNLHSAKVIELTAGNASSLISSELNPSPDARYLLLENKDPEKQVAYEVWLK